MKIKFSFVYIGLCFFLFATLFLVQCTKDKNLTEVADSQAIDIPEIPPEVAAYLTEEQKATFYAGPPTDMAKPDDEISLRNPRQKKWRPFFAWGEATGTFFPLLANCDDPLSAEICFDQNDCPDETAWEGLASYAVGDAVMTGYGQVTQTLQNYICGLVGPENGWLNGTYEKGGDRLQYRPYGIPTVTFNEDNTVDIYFEIIVCNANAPVLDPLCWSYNTGDLAEAEGVINWNWNGPVQGLFSTPFIDVPATIVTWGWLYY